MYMFNMLTFLLIAPVLCAECTEITWNELNFSNADTSYSSNVVREEGEYSYQSDNNIMTANIEHADLLYQHWKHSHEEDKMKEMVFRPAANKFPFSRGRVEFILREDGSCSFLDIARGDGLEENVCNLEQDSSGLKIVVQAKGRTRTFKVISLEVDKLVLVEEYNG